MEQTSPSVVSGMMLAGKYKVDRLLGEGGMGVVLAATNEALRQKVAIKLLRTGALANAKALGRFEREARAAASLRSEHVARVLDVGKLEDGRPYMVMEYLDGQDLGDLIDHGPVLTVGEVVDLVLQACEAVAEAHAAGIIHRDLKPKNLFLSTTVDGRPLVKVLDFGISKMEAAPEEMSLTRTTEIIGSPSYMSPEQLRASKEVDVRTDLWSLGVILYELLTKRLPYVALTVTELVAIILTEPTPDVRAKRPDVPGPLADAITRCLSKKREDRFASVSDLVEVIAPYGSGSLTTMAERISRVAQGSGRSVSAAAGGSGAFASLSSSSASALAPTTGSDLPGTGPHRPALVDQSGLPVASADAPIPSSSARLAINGGTSVSFGETQAAVSSSKPVPSSRPPRWPLVLAGTAVAVLLAGGAALLVHAKYSATTHPTTVTPPATSFELPMGRKDLPPLASSSVAPVETPPTPPASAEPSATTARGEPRRVVKPVVKPFSPPAGSTPTPSKQPDDLSNIGRH